MIKLLEFYYFHIFLCNFFNILLFISKVVIFVIVFEEIIKWIKS